jgi:hypothetical protein
MGLTSSRDATANGTLLPGRRPRPITFGGGDYSSGSSDRMTLMICVRCRYVLHLYDEHSIFNFS